MSQNRAFSFASLIGRSRPRAEDGSGEDENPKDVDDAKRAEWARKAETDDERKQGDDESDEDYEARMLAMDEEEGDGDDSSDEPDDAGKDDDDDEEGDDVKAAVSRERARCAKIIAHGVANNCVRQAGALAFETRLNAREAINVMKMSAQDTQAGKRRGLSSRMADVRIPRIGADGGESASASPSVAGRILAAADKARGRA